MKTLLATIIVLCMLSSVGFAQDYTCGDANYDGGLNLGDVFFMVNYLFGGGPPTPLPDPYYANWDDAEYLTIRDIEVCIHYNFANPLPPLCNVGPAVIPEIDSNFVLLYSNRVPSGATKVRIAMTSYFDVDGLGFELPLNIRVGGAAPTIDSVTFFPRHSYTRSDIYKYMIYPDGEIAIGNAGFWITPETVDQICTIHLTVPESGEERAIAIEWTRLTPIQSLPSDTNCIYPMIGTTSSWDVYEPILTPTCCINAGDANDDGQTNVGDAVFIISYVFKGGPAPYCMSQADANFDTEVNVGDAVFLINYIFRGGPVPICSRI